MPALQAAPVNAGEVIAKARPRVEEGGIEQQAAQQQQDRLLGPAHHQLVDHAAGLMIAAQGVLEAQQVILVGADELDDAIVTAADAVGRRACVGRRRPSASEWACWAEGWNAGTLTRSTERVENNSARVMSRVIAASFTLSVRFKS